MKELEKTLLRRTALCIKVFSDPITFLITMLIFLDFCAQKFPLIFFNVIPFSNQQAMHFRVLNYEKKHKEGTCKVSGRSVVFFSILCRFCFCSKLVIITTLRLRNFFYLLYFCKFKVIITLLVILLYNVKVRKCASCQVLLRCCNQ